MPDSLHRAPSIPETPSFDLIARKWGLERELAAIKAELAARDARVVDQACNLKEHA